MIARPTVHPAELRQILHQHLAPLGQLSRCALINYPNHINIGDHLIWLGNLLYLREVLQVEIGYTASSTTFDANEMEQRVGKVPILLHGGGSLGDLWYTHQIFRERIIQRYPDRSIIILPQTVYFQDQAKGEQAAKIFNQHPDLTIFTRDRISYELARTYFNQCRVLLAPDTALQLTQLADFPVATTPQGIFYQCRSDLELSGEQWQAWGQKQRGDWRAYEDQWVMGPLDTPWKRHLATVIRAGWQRGVRHPKEWWSRLAWDTRFKPRDSLNDIYPQAEQHRSWSFIHSGVYQFRQYRLIITNRLHGHILCTLLKIPHIFLPNCYHKNRAFYDTWTSGLPYCRFVEESSQLTAAISSLLPDIALPD